MGHNERKTYLKKIRSRYRNANKSTKVKILDEFCAVCDYHRKHAISVLNGPLSISTLIGPPKTTLIGPLKTPKLPSNFLYFFAHFTSFFCLQINYFFFSFLAFR